MWRRRRGYVKETGIKNENWLEQLKKERKTIANLKSILWLRKEKEKGKVLIILN